MLPAGGITGLGANWEALVLGEPHCSIKGPMDSSKEYTVVECTIGSKIFIDSPFNKQY